MVTKNDYISLLNSPHLINEQDIVTLQELQKRYPYSGDIQMLLTKGYHSINSINYENQLKNTAISIPNRESLYNLLYKVLLNKEIKNQEETNLVFEEKTNDKIDEATSITEVDNSKEEYNEKPIKKSSTINEILKRKEKTNDKLEELILSHAIGASYVLEEEKKANNPVSEQKEIAKKTTTNKHHSFYSWLTPTEEIEEETTNKNSIGDLVEKFIKTQGNERIKRKEFFSPTNVAKISLVEKDDFITETLADIYFKQQMYNKALKAYEKLILKNPEKKTYFVSQIKKIKSLLA